MPGLTPQYGDLVKFKEAISHLKSKIQIPTSHWDDLLGQIHARAFTIAGATKTELLNDLYKDVLKAIDSGETLSEFRKRFDSTVSKHGWSYNGKRGWRTQVIYQNNKNTARAAGRWEQQTRIKNRRPYLLYLTAGDTRVRPKHAKWNYILLPIEHNFWNSHYPPNGWGCRCKVVSLSDADIKRMELTVTPDSALGDYNKPFIEVNQKTGEELERLPGIDLGWDYNPGKAWIGADKSTGHMIASLEQDIREQIIPQFNAAIYKAEPIFRSHVAKVAAKQALNKKLDDGSVIILGHMHSNTVLKVASKSALGSTLITIDETVLAQAISILGYEQAIRLMMIVQQQGQTAFNKSVVQLVVDGIQVTIQIQSDINRVVAVKRV